MRRSFVLLLAVTIALLLTHDVRAEKKMKEVFSAFLKTASFSDSAHPMDLLVVLEDNVIDPSNTCSDKDECAKKYRLEDRNDYRTYDIASVAVENTTTLRVTLAELPTSTKKLTFVARNLKATPKVGYFEIPVSPQLFQLDIDDSETFEGLRSPIIVQYHTMAPMTVKAGDEAKTRAAMSSALTITDPGEFDRPHQGYVDSIAPLDRPSDFFQLTITGAPRGKKLDMAIGGLETFNGQPQQASGSIQTLPVPKGRDDATLYLKLSAEANNVKRERKYTLDTRIHDVWRAANRWNLGPTLDATFGNKTAKAPNSGAVSLDLRYFFEGTPKFRTNLTLSPIFRTDRSFKNEDLGADVVLEGVIPRLERSLEQRRKEEKRKKGPPLAHVWGWKLRPSVAVEIGRHIKSTTPQIDNSDFERLRAGISAGVEYGKWSLTTSVQHRYLFTEEAVLQDGAAAMVSDGAQTYGRVDLSYDLGVIALTLTHMNGRQPPAFASTHSTALGFTFKF
ncbi:MAG: hypothetical protein QOI24_1205 [Acidobacteriota bacterium]|jgi:hypothetical protein|nr:hypothetical protein [Acidobacteriota bacterium]